MRAEWNDNGATANNVSAIVRKESEPPPRHCDILQSREWFAVMSLELWHQKVAAHLALFVQGGGQECSERTLYDWSSGKHEPPSRILVGLLRSSDGNRVLAWVMRDCEQTWWQAHQRAERIYNALQAELRG